MPAILGTEQNPKAQYGSKGWAKNKCTRVRTGSALLAQFMSNLPVDIRCDVCESAPWKYKCSSCLLKHVCTHLHKDTIDEQPKTEIPLVPLDLGDDCSDYIPTRLLEKLRGSERLMELLSNRHLRNYLAHLDSSRHPAKSIEKAMKEPLFVEFADECLRLINQEEARE
ncbi:Zinc finger HIT domain-containing protein 3 [Taenia crassiceps]|uniref:Zinc finger HIT domain-containing protein 3 n=1 Tax=Taenia crassiceps TaxID=6207 RepID=A0ABR4QKN2_9CEST